MLIPHTPSNEFVIEKVSLHAHTHTHTDIAQGHIPINISSVPTQDFEVEGQLSPEQVSVQEDVYNNAKMLS